MPMAWTSRHQAGRDALHIGFLHHGGERLLGRAAGFQKPGKQEPLRSLEMRSSTPSARVLPDPVEGHRCAAANAPGSSRRRPRPSLAFNFQLHEPLGGKADHLAQQIGIWGLLHERVCRFIISLVIGGSSVALACRNPILPENYR